MPKLRELLAERSMLNLAPERNAHRLEQLERRIQQCHDDFWGIAPGDVIRGYKVSPPPFDTELDPENRDD